MSVILGYKKLKRMASGSSDFLYKVTFMLLWQLLTLLKINSYIENMAIKGKIKLPM